MDINSTVNSTLKVYPCYKQPYVGVVVVLIAMVLCSFVGTPAHSWLLWLFFRDGQKIKPTQVFWLNRIILELIYCIECAVEILNVLILNSRTLNGVSYIAFGISWFGRPLTQMWICVEQYLAVLRPVLFLKYKGFQYRIVLAAVVWLMAAAYAVFVYFTNAFPDPVIDAVIFISLAVILFCYVSVLRALKLPRPGDTQITTERGRDVGNQQKRNAFNTIFTELLLILFGYLPQVLIGFLSVTKLDEELFYCDIVPIMNAFNVLAVMIIPFLKIPKNGHLKCSNDQR